MWATADSLLNLFKIKRNVYHHKFLLSQGYLFVVFVKVIVESVKNTDVWIKVTTSHFLDLYK